MIAAPTTGQNQRRGHTQVSSTAGVPAPQNRTLSLSTSTKRCDEPNRDVRHQFSGASVRLKFGLKVPPLDSKNLSLISPNRMVLLQSWRNMVRARRLTLHTTTARNANNGATSPLRPGAAVWLPSTGVQVVQVVHCDACCWCAREDRVRLSRFGVFDDPLMISICSRRAPPLPLAPACESTYQPATQSKQTGGLARAMSRALRSTATSERTEGASRLRNRQRNA